MKALLLDVGNTRIKWGVLDDGEIRRNRSYLAGADSRQGPAGSDDPTSAPG